MCGVLLLLLQEHPELGWVLLVAPGIMVAALLLDRRQRRRRVRACGLWGRVEKGWLGPGGRTVAAARPVWLAIAYFQPTLSPSRTLQHYAGTHCAHSHFLPHVCCACVCVLFSCLQALLEGPEEEEDGPEPELEFDEAEVKRASKAAAAMQKQRTSGAGAAVGSPQQPARIQQQPQGEGDGGGGDESSGGAEEEEEEEEEEPAAAEPKVRRRAVSRRA